MVDQHKWQNNSQHFFSAHIRGYVKTHLDKNFWRNWKEQFWSWRHLDQIVSWYKNLALFSFSLPKHLHCTPPPLPLLLPFNDEFVAALLPLFILSSHFLFLIKSRLTLTLSRKWGHSIVRLRSYAARSVIIVLINFLYRFCLFRWKPQAKSIHTQNLFQRIKCAK